VTQPIAFIDLQAQRRRIAKEIDAAIARVLDHGAFISAPDVGASGRASMRRLRASSIIATSSLVPKFAGSKPSLRRSAVPATRCHARAAPMRYCLF